MKLYLASIIASTVTIAAQAQTEGTGFSVEASIALDSSLEGNTDVIGAHLHSGRHTVNGPVNIIFCGGSPLPGLLGINGGCQMTDTETTEGIFTATLNAPTSKGAWANGANTATSIPNATTLEEGAQTTYDSFMLALDECTEDECEIYFNFHTLYDFNLNGPFGVARAKLMPVTCPSDKPASAKCYGTNGNVTSNHTNMVDGIPNQLPANVGEASGVLVTYYKMQGGSTNTPTSAGAFQFMASALVALSFVVTVLAI